MPRRSLLSAAERERLLAPPDDPNDLIRHYTLSESDLSVIRQRQGAANRLGFAVLLCYSEGEAIVPTVMRPPIVLSQPAHGGDFETSQS